MYIRLCVVPIACPIRQLVRMQKLAREEGKVVGGGVVLLSLLALGTINDGHMTNLILPSS